MPRFQTSALAALALVVGACSSPARRASTPPPVGNEDASTSVPMDANVPPGPDTGVAAPDAGGPRRDAGVLPSTAFTYSTSCRIPEEPIPTNGVRQEQAFPNLPEWRLSQPIELTQAADGRFFVAEREGLIKVLQNAGTNRADVFLSALEGRVSTFGEAGLLGFVLHPDFAQNGYFYTSYVVQRGSFRSIVSRWSVSNDRNVADPNSERVILDFAQPHDAHNGGDLHFGPDGFLYISFGDGGNTPQRAQDRSNFFGSILRIDVDREENGNPYAIPPSNPFIGMNGVRPEIFAWGFRNPWRIDVDPATGEVWLGDVGEDTWEEVNLVVPGGNHGWAVVEGPDCNPPGSNCDPSRYVPPQLYYGRTQGRSVTGGVVYRGSAIPGLQGAYLYTDFHSDAIYAFRPGQSGVGERLLDSQLGAIAGFGRDNQGEVYALSLGSPQPILKFVPRSGGGGGGNFPQTLSATGCFSSVERLEPATGVLPYELNAPLWSDFAEKPRWISLPAGGKIGFDANGKWTLPDGTILIKHFAMDQDGDGRAEKRLETRFIVKEGQRTRGYTYRWNSAGTEANLLAGAESEVMSVQRGAETHRVDWAYPSRPQCQSCHLSASGGVLGLETAQLNRDVSFPALAPSPVNQIDVLRAYGLFASDPGSPESMSRFPSIDDTQASVASRARAYLHSNCANCHLRAGGTSSRIELRALVPLSDTETCDRVPGEGDLGLPDARIVAPGRPGSSVLLDRMRRRDEHRMPPVGSSVIDEAASRVVAEWIASMSDCTGF